MPILAWITDEPPTEPVERQRVHAYWTSARGDVVHLTACENGLNWLPGRGGLDMPPYETLEDDVPDGDGATIRGVRALPRTVTLPLLLHSTEFDSWRSTHQRLIRALDPLPGDGQLRVVQPDGTSRILTARYADGAEGESVRDVAGLWWRIWAVKLRAVDPWWYADTAVTLTWGNHASSGFFPLLPVRLSSSNVLGTTTAHLDGDVRTWGVWTIHGPANGPVLLRSETLDRDLTLNLSGTHQLAAGQTVVVDMRPRRESIRGPGGTNWWAARSGVPSMWWLEPGSNHLVLSVAGASSATRVDFHYTPAWISA